jgi:plastocyanin
VKRTSQLCSIAGLAITLTAAGGAIAAAQTDPALPVVTVAMTGSSIAVGGTLQSGAVTVTSTETAKEGNPTFILLNPGVTAQQVIAALPKAHDDPNVLSPLGSIVFDGDAVKGTSSVQTQLPAGNYIAFDSINDNAAKWPSTTFTVAAATAPATLPAAQATVHAIEYAFKAPKTLKVGQTVRWQNDGWLVHMIFGLKVKDKATAKKVEAGFLAGKDRQIQKLIVGLAPFMGPVSHGGMEQGKLTAAPGYYVLACFMPAQDGREHTRLGMFQTVHVVK